MHGLKPAPQSPYNNAHWPGPDARRLPSITLRGRLPHTRTSNHPLPPCVRAGRSLPQVFPLLGCFLQPGCFQQTLC